MEKVKIVVASHKVYQMPEDKMYLPLQVGAARGKSIGYETDDQGENISNKNNSYCELTGIYWAWKNLDADYIGLVHYRRYFTVKKKRKSTKHKYQSIASNTDILHALKEGAMIVPQKRNYYIETIYSHYGHTHYSEHLDKSLEIIKGICPEYVSAFERIMKARSGYMFNMFVMSSEELNAYCEWLFPILFELEKQVDSTQYSSFQARYIGRVSEILFNVWLDYNNKKVTELPYLYLGKVNWPKKIMGFLLAKVGIKKYTSSF